MFGSHTQDEFSAKLQTFVEGCRRIHADHITKNYPKSSIDSFDVDWLQKRVRVKRNGSAHCFVVFATGDVLMPSSYKTPAKHARGNIYDDKNGLGSMGPYGPAYLR